MQRSGAEDGAARVGVFDSGLGGLSVVLALRALMPTLPVHYLADGEAFPYGERSEEVVRERSVLLTERLLGEGCTLVVLACNTATSAALPALRARYPVPFVGMEPPIKPALRALRGGKVLALVTPTTARGERLARLRRTCGDAGEVVVAPMPGLADLVEQGEVRGEAIDRCLRGALAGVGQAVEHVVLGCTHYGFLRGPLESLLGPGVRVHDAAAPVARRVRHQLAAHELGIPPAGSPPVRVGTTGDLAALARSLQRIQGDHPGLAGLPVELDECPESRTIVADLSPLSGA